MTAYLFPKYRAKKKVIAAKPKEKEQDIQNAILDYLNLKGIFAWQNKTQGTYDPVRKRFRSNPRMKKGVSDILGIFKGKPLAIEVKTEKGKATEEQKIFLQRFQAEGGVAGVVRSIEDVENLLNGVCS